MSIEKQTGHNLRDQGKGSSGKDYLSPWARYWERQQRSPQDNHLVSFGDRVTYTFAVGTEAASLHYDHARGKIFYKGHRVGSGDLYPGMVKLLNHFKDILAKSEYSEQFLDGYLHLLEKLQLQASEAPDN